MASATGTVNKPYKSTHGLNSLTLRLMGVNILAMLVIGIGILQMGQFRTAVIATELSLLETETKIIAASLSEQVQKISDLKKLDPFLRKLSQANGRSILLYDSHALPTAFARFEKEEETTLPKTTTALEDVVNTISILLPIEYKLPIYKENTGSPHLAPDRIKALKGKLSVSAWQSPDGRLIFSAGAPLVKDSATIGAVVVIKDETQTEAAMLQTRVDMARIMLAILIITSIMLIYFAAVVGRPLNRLVDAADKIRHSRSRSVEIPDFSFRNDEIGALSTAFRDMTSALWTRMDSIESFAADVAHELKNPLTSMRSAVETLPRTKNDEQRAQLIGILSHDIRRMDRLVTDISRASRVDAELSRETISMVDLVKLIHDVKSALEIQTNARQARIDIRFNTQDAFLTTGSQGRLAQVFENLIMNALSFAPPHSAICILLEQRAGFIVVSIEDQGQGIPSGKEEKIFERFYSERPSGEKFGEHSGLGLAICRQIVTSYGGTIRAENIMDENVRILGARFILTLKDAT